MNLIDKQDCVWLFFQRREQSLKPLLEITAVLGPSDEGTEVEGIDHRIGEHLRNLPFDDLARQSLG